MESTGDVETALQRRQKKPEEEGAEAPPQMLRRGKKGHPEAPNNAAGTIFVTLSFVILVVVSWWGLMTAVMGSAHTSPKRVTPSTDAKHIIKQTEGLIWDDTYAQHAGQVGWVLEDRGTQLNIGFPDGTTKWYPADALTDVLEEATHTPKKHKKHKKKGRRVREEDQLKMQEDDQEQAEGDQLQQKHEDGEVIVNDEDAQNKPEPDPETDTTDAPKKKHKKKKKRHHHDDSSDKPHDIVDTENLESDSHKKHKKHHQTEDSTDAKSDEALHEINAKKHKQHDIDSNSHEGSENAEVHKKHKKRKKKHHHDSEETDAKPDSEDSVSHKKHKRHEENSAEHENSASDTPDTHPDASKGEDAGSAGDTEAPKKHKKRRRKKHKKRHDDSTEGAGSAAEDTQEGTIKVTADVTHLSLDSAIPKQKKTCTYPMLHPHKWSEKFGWGQKKSFPKCSEDAPFSVFRRVGRGGVFEQHESKADGASESDSDSEDSFPVEAPLTASVRGKGFTLKFERRENNDKTYAVDVSGGDVEPYEIVRVAYENSNGHEVLVTTPRFAASVLEKDTRSNIHPMKNQIKHIELARTLLNAASIPHNIPRTASLEITCEGKAKAFGMYELPDSFFNKMSTTLDAEKRQNLLKNLYTQDQMEKTDYKVDDDGMVECVIHPYVVAECSGKRELHINLDATGRHFRSTSQKKKLNILHVMFDSSSFPALVRACPKITKQLEAINNNEDSPSRVFSFKHLHAVSCCSPGNQIPMYAGRMNGEGSPFVAAEPKQQSKNWLWNIANSLGFTSFFSLDNCPDKSARDFQANPSVDHRVVAPMCMAGILLSHKERPCLTNKPITEYVFDGVKQFWDMYPNTPKYAAVQLITPHEETEKMLIELDDPMSSLLKQLEETHILNDTAVFFFSDHGINFGRYAQTHDGEIEKMFPFAHLILPRWLQKEGNFDFEALRSNENALVNPYDMHQMLREILHYPAPAPPYAVDETDPPLPKPEQSHIVASMKKLQPFEKVLHRPVSFRRSCTDANIAPEFCTCIDWSTVEEENFKKYSEHTKGAVARHKEILTEVQESCLEISLGEVVSVELQVWPVEYHPKEHLKAKKIWMAPNRDMLRIVYSIAELESSRFEAMLSLDKTDSTKFEVAAITRIDAMQKKCGVVEKKMEILCICK